MSTKVTIHTPGALAGAIPAMIGFTPAESVMIVGMSAAKSVAVLLRLDLADLVDAASRVTHAEQSARYLERCEAHHAVVLVYTQQSVDHTRDSVAAFATMLNATSINDAWHVSADTVRAYDHTTPPQPIEAPNEAIAGTVLHSTAGSATTDEVAAGIADSNTDAFAVWLEGLDNPADVTEHALGVILGAMASIVFRDACVISLMPGHRDTAAALLANPKAPGVPEALSHMISGPDQPGPEQLSHLVLLERLVNAAPTEYRPAPATLAALLWWWKGDNSRAAAYLTQARHADRAYRFAALVSAAVDMDMPPGWLAHATAA